MHSGPMKDSDGDFGPETPEPTIQCKFCGSRTVVSTVWESSCGGYEDLKYQCWSEHCGRIWWVEGPDA